MLEKSKGGGYLDEMDLPPCVSDDEYEDEEEEEELTEEVAVKGIVEGGEVEVEKGLEAEVEVSVEKGVVERKAEVEAVESNLPALDKLEM